MPPPRTRSKLGKSVETRGVISLSTALIGTGAEEVIPLGAATGAVCVADNQEEGYRTVVAEGLAAPVGRLADLTSNAADRKAAVTVLTRLLADPAARSALATQGWRQVDGRGRERVADVLLAVMG